MDDGEGPRFRLEAERDRLEGLIASVRGDVDDGNASEASELAHYDQHPADSGSETFEREKDLSILETLENELAEIEAALRRVDEGTYGIDEATGEPIAADRLAAVPTARRNLSPAESHHDRGSSSAP